MKGHFAFVNNYLICGGCGSSMAPYTPPTPIDNEYTYRVYCGNNRCPNYLEVYEPSDKIKVSLIPTRLRAPDPALAMAGQAQAQVTNAGTLPGMAGTIGIPTRPEVRLQPLPRNIADWEAAARTEVRLVTQEEVNQRLDALRLR